MEARPMSEPPKRFDDVIDMLTHDCHKYALEVARLKAERVHDLNQIGGLQQELASLRAEVERLTDAITRGACIPDAKAE